MPLVTQSADTVFAPTTSGGAIRSPNLGEVHAWAKEIQALVLTAAEAGKALLYDSKAALDADLAYGANTMAWVLSDPTPGNNGIYRKSGGIGAGFWTLLGQPLSQSALDVIAGNVSVITAALSELETQAATTDTNLAALTADYLTNKPAFLDAVLQLLAAKGLSASLDVRMAEDRKTAAGRADAGPHYGNTIRNWFVKGGYTYAKQLVNKLIEFSISPNTFKNREKIDEVYSELDAMYGGGLLYRLSGGAIWDSSGRHLLARVDKYGRTLLTGPGRIGAPMVVALDQPRWTSSAPGTGLSSSRTYSLISDPDVIVYVPALSQSFGFASTNGDPTWIYSVDPIAPGKALMPKQNNGKLIWVDSDADFDDFEDLAGKTGHGLNGVNLGESPLYEMTRHWLAACQARLGFQPETLVTLAGAGGQSLMQIWPGTVNWIEWEKSIVLSRNAARRRKKRLFVPFAPLIFGQSMFEFYGDYVQLKRSVLHMGMLMQQRIMYLTGEFEVRPLIAIAPVTRYTYTTATIPRGRPALSAWNRAVQELTAERPDIFVNYGAGYQHQLYNDGHRTPTGYRQEGKSIGIAMENAVLSTGHTDFHLVKLLRLDTTLVRGLLYTGDGGLPLVRPPGTEDGIGNPSDTGAYNYIGPAIGKYAQCCGFQCVDATNGGGANNDFIGVESVTLGGFGYDSHRYIDIALSRAPIGNTGLLLVGAQGQAVNTQGTNADTARTTLRTDQVATIAAAGGGTVDVFNALSPGRFEIPAL